MGLIWESGTIDNSVSVEKYERKKNEDMKPLLPVEALLCVSGVCSPYLVANIQEHYVTREELVIWLQHKPVSGVY